MNHSGDDIRDVFDVSSMVWQKAAHTHADVNRPDRNKEPECLNEILPGRFVSTRQSSESKYKKF